MLQGGGGSAPKSSQMRAIKKESRVRHPSQPSNRLQIRLSIDSRVALRTECNQILFLVATRLGPSFAASSQVIDESSHSPNEQRIQYHVLCEVEQCVPNLPQRNSRRSCWSRAY